MAMNHCDAATEVLVADRLEMFRRGIIEVLHETWPQWSYRSAGSIGDLRTFPGGERSNLLMLDLNLPGLGGVTGIQQMRAHDPDCAMIVVGDREDRSVILECLGAGALGYILRTTSCAQLLRAVETTLSGAVFAPACLAGRSGRAAVVANIPVEEPAPPCRSFTGRQNDVFRLLAEGCATKIIARRLSLSVGTVKVHLAAIYRHLGVHGRVEALARVRGFDMRESALSGYAADDTKAMETHRLAA